MGKRVAVLVGLLLVRLIVGGYSSSSCQTGQRIRVAGIISEIEQNGSNQIVSVGQFRVNSEAKNTYSRTEKVVIIGKCERQVIDFFLGRIWLMDPQITSRGKISFADNSWWHGGQSLQSALTARLQKQLPEPEASLLAGIVLGAKNNLPNGFYQALINTGTIHMVVASGYNLSVIGEVLFYILIYFVSRKWATSLAIFGMIGYSWMTGFGVPVMRALIMGSLVLVSRVMGRAGETAWWLLLAVWLMLMWSPELILNISFQLSVAATTGLIFIEPMLNKVLSIKYYVLSMLAKTELAPTLSAQIMTAPLIWWHFGRLSLISPFVNLLVLPLVPPLMMLGAMQLVFGVVIAPFSYALLHLIVVIINFFG